MRDQHGEDRLERLEAALTRPREAPDEAALRLEAAQILLARETDPSRALEHLQVCWRLQPGDPDVSALLGRCLAASVGPAAEAEFQRHTAEQLPPDQQAVLLRRAAELSLEAGDPAGVLLAARQLRPAELPLPLLQEAASRLAQQGHTEQAVAGLELVLPRLTGDRAFACTCQLASLHAELDQQQQALELWLRALELRPGAPEALDPVRQVLEQLGQLPRLVSLLGQAVHQQRDPQRRQELGLDLARLAAELEPEHAAKAWGLAWEAGHPEAPARLRQLHADRGDWAGHSQVLQAMARQASSGAERADLLRELARVQRERLHQPEAAAATCLKLLQLLPGDETALAMRAEIFADLGQDLPLAAALERYLRHSVQRRDVLLRQLVRLRWRERLPRSTAPLLEQLDPDDQENLALAEQLAAEMERDDDGLQLELAIQLLGLLRRGQGRERRRGRLAASLASTCREAGHEGLSRRCARLAGELDPELAQELLPRGPDPGQGPGDRPSAVESLEREAGEQDDPLRAVELLLRAAAISDDDHQQERLLRRAAERGAGCGPEPLALLEGPLRRSGLLAALADLLRAATEQEHSLPQRRALHQDLARCLQDASAPPERVAQALQQQLLLDGDDSQAARQLWGMRRQLQPGRRALMLEALLEHPGELQPGALHQELGRLHSTELEDEAAAARHYETLLALEPDHPEALAFCRRLLEREGDQAAIVELLAEAAAAAEDPKTRSELHGEAASLAEHELEQLELAAAHWQLAAAALPHEPGPLEQLKRVLTRSEQWPQLEQVLLEQTARTHCPTRRLEQLRQLAALARERLDDPDRAAEQLTAALQLAPGDARLTSELARDLESAQRWDRLATLLLRQARQAQDPQQRLEARRRAAHVLLERLDREQDGLALCRAILEDNPGDREAAGLQAEVLGKRGRWQEQAALLRDLIASESAPDELGRLHLELGRILLQRLADAETAAIHFEVALNLDPPPGETLTRVREIYEGRGELPQMLQLMVRRSKRETLDRADRAASLCEVGAIRLGQQSDADGAQQAYQQALVLEPDCRPALAALTDLALQRERWWEVVHLGQREARLVQDPGQRGVILTRVGEALHRRLNSPDEAAVVLEQALELDGSNRAALAWLAEIRFGAGDWQQAARLTSKLVGVKGGDRIPALHEHLYRLAYATERLGRTDEAFPIYVKSFTRDPGYLPTLDRLAQLCFDRSQWENTQRIAGAILENHLEHKSPQQIGELHYKLGLSELLLAQRSAGAWFLQELVLKPGHQPAASDEAWGEVASSWASTPLEPRLLSRVGQEAVQGVTRSLQRCLAYLPEHGDAHQVLAALSLEAGHWDQGVRHLEQAAQAQGIPPDLAARLSAHAGELALGRLQDRGRASGAFRRALELDPDSASARRQLEALRPAVESSPPGDEPILLTRVKRHSSAPPPPPADEDDPAPPRRRADT